MAKDQVRIALRYQTTGSHSSLLPILPGNNSPAFLTGVFSNLSCRFQESATSTCKEQSFTWPQNMGINHMAPDHVTGNTRRGGSEGKSDTISPSLHSRLFKPYSCHAELLTEKVMFNGGKDKGKGYLETG